MRIKFFKWPMLIAVLFVLGIFFAFYILQKSDVQIPVVHTIELTKDGFSPATTTINKGDTVRFISKRGVQFWPASNEHPIHSVYSEFDPKRPLEPNETWEFKFTRGGTWEYHDHLYSFFAGVIVVK